MNLLSVFAREYFVPGNIFWAVIFLIIAFLIFRDGRKNGLSPVSSFFWSLAALLCGVIVVPLWLTVRYFYTPKIKRDFVIRSSKFFKITMIIAVIWSAVYFCFLGYAFPKIYFEVIKTGEILTNREYMKTMLVIQITAISLLGFFIWFAVSSILFIIGKNKSVS